MLGLWGRTVLCIDLGSARRDLRGLGVLRASPDVSGSDPPGGQAVATSGLSWGDGSASVFLGD